MKFYKSLLVFCILIISWVSRLSAQADSLYVDSLLNDYENKAWQLRLENGEEATRVLHKIITLSRKHNKQGWIAFGYRKLVTQKAFQGQVDSIDYYFAEGFKHIENDTTQIKNRLGKLHSEMGEATRMVGKPAKALFHYKKSDSLFRLDKDSLGVVIAAINLGNTHYVQGDFTNSIERYLKGLPLVDTTQYLYIPSALYKGIAASYVELDNDSLSIFYTEKALHLAMKEIETYPEYVVPPLIDLSRKEFERGNKQVAYTYITQADSIALHYNLNRVLPLLATQRASLLLSDNEAKKALEVLKGSQEMLVQFPLAVEDNFQFKYNLGLAHYRTGNTDEALKIFERLATQAETLKYPKEIAQINQILSEIYADNRQYNKAYEAQLRFKSVSDSLYTLDKQSTFKEIETRYQTAEKEVALAQTRATLAERELQVRQRNNIIYGVIGIAIILGLLGYLFYNQQRLRNIQLKREGELQTALAKIETQNRLQEQRLRISRDLHDNIGSQLTFITSGLDNLKYGLQDKQPEITEKLSEITSFTRTTINELRDTIWAMNKEEITFEDLEARIQNFLEQARKSSPDVIFTLDMNVSPSMDKVLTSVEGVNLFRIVQEAINNAIKYASASAIDISIVRDYKEIVTTVMDNGNGFNIQTPSLGNGLRNMKKRAQDINGKFLIVSDERGTEVCLSMAL